MIGYNGSQKKTYSIFDILNDYFISPKHNRDSDYKTECLQYITNNQNQFQLYLSKLPSYNPSVGEKGATPMIVKKISFYCSIMHNTNNLSSLSFWYHYILFIAISKLYSINFCIFCCDNDKNKSEPDNLYIYHIKLQNMINIPCIEIAYVNENGESRFYLLTSKNNSNSNCNSNSNQNGHELVSFCFVCFVCFV